MLKAPPTCRAMNDTYNQWKLPYQQHAIHPSSVLPLRLLEALPPQSIFYLTNKPRFGHRGACLDNDIFVGMPGAST